MNINVTTDIPPARCGRCGAQVECVSGAREPTPGDLSVCSECGVAMILGRRLILRPLTGAEAQQLLADPERLENLARMTRAVLAMKAMRG
jgi:hypothetical protein